MSEKKKIRVLWLTNLPAPYRFPIWDRMAEEVQLKVVFLLKRRNWRNWPEPRDKRWQHQFLSFNSLQISEYDIIPSFRGARKILKDVDVAVIGGWESPMYIRTILLAKKMKINVIQFYGSTADSHRFGKGVVALARKWILSKPDSIIAISESSARSLINMGIPPESLAVLFNPVDVQWFYDYSVVNQKAPNLGHKFIYVGQLIDRKNVDSIIRAFSNVRLEHDSLTIAGEGHLLGSLKDLAKICGVESSVHFVGHRSQEDIAELFTENHTLVLASTNEVWGLVVNEALASGLQVIVTSKCGVSEFVKNMNGATVISADLDSLGKAMIESRENWTGYLRDPDILKYTPEKFADSILKLVQG